MTTLHSVEYYERNDKQYYGKQGTVNFEEKLNHKLEGLTKESFPEDSWKIIVNTFAKQVVEETEAKLLEDKKLCDKIKKDSNCLGYTTKIQEVQAVNRILTIFEYNCFKLKQFKEKYNL